MNDTGAVNPCVTFGFICYSSWSQFIHNIGSSIQETEKKYKEQKNTGYIRKNFKHHLCVSIFFCLSGAPLFHGYGLLLLACLFLNNALPCDQGGAGNFQQMFILFHQLLTLGL